MSWHLAVILKLNFVKFFTVQIFCPSLGAEFRPHSQSKIATFSPIQYHICFSELRKVKKKKKIPYLLGTTTIMRNSEPYQNDS